MSPRATPRPKRRRGRFVVATALLVGASTVVVVLGFFTLAAYLDPFPRSPIRIAGDFTLAPDDELGFVQTAGASTTRRQVGSDMRFDIHTDRRGARVDSPADETPDRVALLTVGGSFSWGHGLDNRETFTHRLGRAFGVPAANLSFGSFGTVQSAVLLERNLDLEPEVVIYGFIADHLRRNLAPCAPSHSPYCLPVAHVAFDDQGRPFVRRPLPGYFTLERNRAFYRDVLLKDDFGWHDVMWRMRVDLLRVRDAAKFSYEASSEKKRQALELLLDRMIGAAGSVNARLVVVHLPQRLETPITTAPPELEAAIAGRDVEYLDLAPVVSGHYEQPGAVSLAIAGDGHPAANGHRLIAAALEDLIRRRPLLANPGEAAASAPAP